MSWSLWWWIAVPWAPAADAVLSWSGPPEGIASQYDVERSTTDGGRSRSERGIREVLAVPHEGGERRVQVSIQWSGGAAEEQDFIVGRTGVQMPTASGRMSELAGALAGLVAWPIPRSPVEPGEAWSQDATSELDLASGSIGIQLGIDARATHRFTGWITVAGERLAALATEATIEGTGRWRGVPGGSRVTVEAAFSGDVLVEPVSGLVVASAVELSLLVNDERGRVVRRVEVVEDALWRPRVPTTVREARPADLTASMLDGNVWLALGSDCIRGRARPLKGSESVRLVAPLAPSSARCELVLVVGPGHRTGSVVCDGMEERFNLWTDPTAVVEAVDGGLVWRRPVRLAVLPETWTRFVRHCDGAREECEQVTGVRAEVATSGVEARTRWAVWDTPCGTACTSDAGLVPLRLARRWLEGRTFVDETSGALGVYRSEDGCSGQ